METRLGRSSNSSRFRCFLYDAKFDATWSIASSQPPLSATERKPAVPRRERVQPDIDVLQSRQTPQRKRQNRRAAPLSELNPRQARHVYAGVPQRGAHSMRSQTICFSAFSPTTSASKASSATHCSPLLGLCSVTARSDGMQLSTSRSCVVAPAECRLLQTTVCSWQAEEKSVGRKRAFLMKLPRNSTSRSSSSTLHATRRGERRFFSRSNAKGNQPFSASNSRFAFA